MFVVFSKYRNFQDRAGDYCLANFTHEEDAEIFIKVKTDDLVATLDDVLRNRIQIYDPDRVFTEKEIEFRLEKYRKIVENGFRIEEKTRRCKRNV